MHDAEIFNCQWFANKHNRVGNQGDDYGLKGSYSAH